ncbi:pentapeptide repeat-containing protein [Actinophytocola sp.]|uniref:pentapeptide repeat-containing protein n=1 Tax=Actinophytocola sp. TaxID=1872138 RepID=UPI002ED23694
MTTELRGWRAAPHYEVLSERTILVWAVGVVLAGVGVAVWLLLAYTGGDAEANRVRLDAIRTAGTIVVGTGGAAALLLAARRQRSTEIALKQKERDQFLQERVALTTEADAEARRITDLYTKAVEQLGSEKAPVRLGGLYALERLAQDHVKQRQTIVNVLCAYLRMPDAPPDDDTTLTVEQVQEREVRLTAQRLLTIHLRPGGSRSRPVATFWEDIDLDLTGATLINLDLIGCRANTIRFTNAHLTGRTSFDKAEFTGAAVFHGARFTGFASFREARFTDSVWFSNAHFTDSASYIRALFTGTTTFHAATFSHDTWFDEARFTGATSFSSAQFTRDASFKETGFNESIFREARFTGSATFEGALFTSTPAFNGTQFAVAVPPEAAPFWSPPVVDAGQQEGETSRTE